MKYLWDPYIQTIGPTISLDEVKNRRFGRMKKYFAVGVDYYDDWPGQREFDFEYDSLATDCHKTEFENNYYVYDNIEDALSREGRILDHGTKIYHMTLNKIEKFFGVSLISKNDKNDKDMYDVELKPCPFCGSEPNGIFGPHPEIGEYFIECSPIGEERREYGKSMSI